MKTLLKGLLGLGDIRDMVIGMMLLFMGMLIIANAQIGIKTPTGDVRWIAAFADLDEWVGWVLLWFGFDSFFGMKLTGLLRSLLTSIFNPIIKGVLGVERVKRWQEQLKRKQKDDGGKEVSDADNG